MEREIGAAGVGEDVIRRERQAGVPQDLVAENPEIPDVYARISTDSAEQVRPQVERKRPCQEAREGEVRPENDRTHRSCVLAPFDHRGQLTSTVQRIASQLTSAAVPAGPLVRITSRSTCGPAVQRNAGLRDGAPRVPPARIG